jgi:hypothetical protein
MPSTPVSSRSNYRPLPYSSTNANMGYNNPGNRKIDVAFSHNTPQPSNLSAADFQQYVNTIYDNPFTRQKLLGVSLELGGLITNDPKHDQMLAPGFPYRFVTENRYRTGEIPIYDPTSDDTKRFSGTDFGAYTWQVTHSRATSGAEYRHIEQMASEAALRMAGLPSIRDLILQVAAESWAIEAKRLAFAQLLSILHDNFLNGNSDLVMDISSNDASIPKFVVLMHGNSPIIHYNNVAAGPADTGGLASVEVHIDSISGRGNGKTTFMERRKYYCIPVGYQWVGGHSHEYWTPRLEIADVGRNWQRIPEFVRSDYEYGAIICNDAQQEGVSPHNCLTADRIFEAKQKFFGMKKESITNLLMPSSVHSYLQRQHALAYLPDQTAGLPPVTVFAGMKVTMTDMFPLWRPDLPISEQFPYLMPTDIQKVQEGRKQGIIYMDGIS